MHTKGPWPVDYTGDGKRIIVGEGLVEGPNGYDVAEVYSDDCPRAVAEANARLIAASPDLLEACKALLASHRPGVGQCCAASDLGIAAIAKATGDGA